VEISVDAPDHEQTYLVAASAVRAAIHAADGFTPDWSSTPPERGSVATALSSAEELIGS